MKKGNQLIRFDWAIKKLLRNKANFDILEGFLTELLGEEIKIKQILDSESNKETHDDKYNRVDILVENSKKELLIIEVQNSKEYDYFQRILYGTSKAITEYMKEGDAYAKIKKIISITIAYFDLGQGKDYVYHGKSQFRGIHHGDVLNLSQAQQELYNKQEVHQIFPEYWLIKVSQFNNAVQDKLDEWIYFLKNGEIEEDFTAKGLTEAKQKLDKMNLSKEERIQYKYYLRRLMDIASENYNKEIEIQLMLKETLKEGIEKGRQEGIEKGRQEGLEEGIQEGMKKKEIEAVLGAFKVGVSPENISKALNISLERVQEILTNHP